MSNGVIAAGCCCGACIDCCKFWEEAPSTINVTISFSQINNFTIVEGSQSYDYDLINWTITATLTKSGSCCDYPNCVGNVIPRYSNLLRYTADVCQVSAQRISRAWSFGRTWNTCSEYIPPSCFDLPGPCLCVENPIGNCPQFIGGTQYSSLTQSCTGSPCTDLNLGLPPNEGYTALLRDRSSCRQWNCSGSGACQEKADVGDCNCTCPSVGELEWKNISSEELNYSATITGLPLSVPCNYTPGTPPMSTCSGCPNFPDCPNCGPYGGGAVNAPAVVNKVMTLWCGVSSCDGECNVPVLVFNPGDQQDVLHSITYEIPTCCGSYCPGESPYAGIIDEGECFKTITYEEPICFPKFQIQGLPGELNSASFSEAVSNCDINFTLGFNILEDPWITCCQKLNKIYCSESYQDNEDPASGYFCANSKFVSCDQPLQFNFCKLPSWTRRDCVYRNFGVTIT